MQVRIRCCPINHHGATAPPGKFFPGKFASGPLVNVYFCLEYAKDPDRWVALGGVTLPALFELDH